MEIQTRCPSPGTPPTDQEARQNHFGKEGEGFQEEGFHSRQKTTEAFRQYESQIWILNILDGALMFFFPLKLIK